jgi:Na+(H+)/acetate symporter ActP
MVNSLNSNGIPLPTVRDPKTGRGSVALTLVVISSFMVVAALIGKFSNFLQGVDISNALQFFYASSGLYWARKFNSDSGPDSKSPKDASEAPRAQE